MRLIRAICALLAAVVTTGLVAVPAARVAAAPTLPAGFRQTVAFDGLDQPTVVRFARDGRVFVAEKSGRIRVFDGPGDTTPATWADLRTQVHDFNDRGLLGLALAPDFPDDPSVYALYTLDADPAAPDRIPRYGRPGEAGDGCPDPPANSSGCPALGRLSRLTPGAGGGLAVEEPLVTGWCQQWQVHSMGALAFGADGSLYASAGDGAGFVGVDYGQSGGTGGVPLNPCGDPPGGVGATLTPPTAQGGSLRSQDLRTPADPTGLNGSVIRVDPRTGAGAAGNPLAGSADVNARRIVAHGLRNPFRIAVRPGTDEVWVGDVGYYLQEEVNRIPAPGGRAPDNFGWPCYEGPARQPAVDGTDLDLCEDLYAEGPGAVVAPHWAYAHGQRTAAGESCPTDRGSSVGGLAFYPGGSYPAAYDSALFVADYARGCIWVMGAGAGGQPDPATVAPFLDGASTPVDLVAGPDGDLHYADILGGRIVRIAYGGEPTPPPPPPPPGNTAPTATIDTPDPATTWAVGQRIAFSGGATDPQDGTLPAGGLRWDLVLNHCEAGGGCHAHPLQSWEGVASGSFTAPDHEYPSELVLRLTATDAGGMRSQASVTLLPRTVDLTLATDPAGLEVAINGEVARAPLTRRVIVGSRTSVSAVSPQGSRVFERWSDGGTRTHEVVAPAAPVTLTATYRAAAPAWQAYARVDFLPTGAPVPVGYRADTGAIYGDRGGARTFGWNAVNGSARDRNSARSPDQRYDAIVHTQKRTNPVPVWELAVPSGSYRVRLVCGDPDHIDSVYRVDVEGVRACNDTPTSTRRWTEVTVEVRVTDGRLTLTNAPGSRNNKLAFVDVDQLVNR